MPRKIIIPVEEIVPPPGVGDAWEPEPELPVFVSADLFRLEPRFAKWLDIETESGCWYWNAGTQKSGARRTARYGRIWVPWKSNKHPLVHRYAYELIWGRPPEGWEVHHTCLHTLCCNPNHLIAVTPEQHDLIHGGRRYYR